MYFKNGKYYKKFFCGNKINNLLQINIVNFKS